MNGYRKYAAAVAVSALFLLMTSLFGANADSPSAKSTEQKAGIDMGTVDRCPVCREYIFRHPRWVVLLYYEKNGAFKHLAFDGLKEFMKFYAAPEKWGDYANIRMHVKKIVVRDYATRKPVIAQRAWYVAGSDVNGSKGSEYIPFKSRKSAEEFMKKHHGKRLLRFDEIVKESAGRLP